MTIIISLDFRSQVQPGDKAYYVYDEWLVDECYFKGKIPMGCLLTLGDDGELDKSLSNIPSGCLVSVQEIDRFDWIAEVISSKGKKYVATPDQLIKAECIPQ